MFPPISELGYFFYIFEVIQPTESLWLFKGIKNMNNVLCTFTLLGKALQEHALFSTFVSITFIFLWSPTAWMFVAMHSRLTRYRRNIVWIKEKNKLFDYAKSKTFIGRTQVENGLLGVRGKKPRQNTRHPSVFFPLLLGLSGRAIFL